MFGFHLPWSYINNCRLAFAGRQLFLALFVLFYPVIFTPEHRFACSACCFFFTSWGVAPHPTSFCDKRKRKTDSRFAPFLFFSFLSFISISFVLSLFYLLKIFSNRSIASIVFSLDPKAVILNQPSPFLPKPSPGVPTTSASFNSLWKNSQLPISSGHLNHM